MGILDIVNIRRWQWIVASILIGLLFGYVQQLRREKWTEVFGETLIKQYFEEGLIREQSGYHWFRNLVVYPEWVEVGGRKQPIYIVAGDYHNGQLEIQNGQRVAVWRPRCFIAEVPYKPRAPVAGFPANGTVLEYLQSPSHKGVSYTYAWWSDLKWGMSLWTAGSFVVIGLVWPTAINLLAFGSLFRPKEEKGTDLSKVTTATTATDDRPRLTDADLERVEELGRKLEGELETEAPSSAPGTQDSTQPAPLRHLTAQEVELAAQEKIRQEKEFGKSNEDFYPTERHAEPRKSH